MRATLIAIGERQPAWVNEGYAEYVKRLSHDLPLALIEIPLGARGKGRDIKRAIAEEGARTLAAIPKGAHVVALDEHGTQWSSKDLAQQLEAWRRLGQDLAFLIGGPDGHAAEVLAASAQRWSLSALTLPHALVRIVLAEQIYRAVSLLGNHPYHRG